MHKNDEAILFIAKNDNCPTYLEIFWETVDFGVGYVAEDGTWLKANPALCEILQYTERELQQRTIQQVTHYDDIIDDSYMRRRVIDGELKEYNLVTRCITKTYQMILVKTKVIGVYDNDGKFTHFVQYIIPNIVISNAPSVQIDAGLDAGKDKGIKKFVKENWKWAASTTVLFLVFSVNELSEYKVLQNQIKDTILHDQEQSEEINSIKKTLETIINKLDTIKINDGL